MRRKNNFMNMNIACDLSVFGSKDNAMQHEKNSGSVLKNNEGVEEFSEGYAFRYTYTPEMFTTLSHWITMENKCCPFFTFALRLVPDGAGRMIWLEIGGSKQIKEFIALNFKSSFDIDLKKANDPTPL
jgi:hypothetical protein